MPLFYPHTSPVLGGTLRQVLTQPAEPQHLQAVTHVPSMSDSRPSDHEASPWTAQLSAPGTAALLPDTSPDSQNHRDSYWRNTKHSSSLTIKQS